MFLLFALYIRRHHDTHAGTVKGLTPGMLEDCKCHLILGNTYHLGNRPGASAVEELGGLHKFSGWNRAMLTDSGAFHSSLLPTFICLYRLAEIDVHETMRMHIVVTKVWT